MRESDPQLLVDKLTVAGPVLIARPGKDVHDVLPPPPRVAVDGNQQRHRTSVDRDCHRLARRGTTDGITGVLPELSQPDRAHAIAADSPDQRYDTLTHLQKPQNLNASWELAVPNGTYRVRAVSGDPSNVDGTYRLNAEGATVVSGTPTSAQRWIEGTVTVSVTDGRLTVSNGSGAVNNKLNFIEVTLL